MVMVVVLVVPARLLMVEGSASAVKSALFVTCTLRRAVLEIVRFWPVPTPITIMP